MLVKIFALSLFIFILACSDKEDISDPYAIDPTIKKNFIGSYTGDCFAFHEDHTGQSGGYSFFHDTLYNSRMEVTAMIPVTEYYHTVVIDGGCFPDTEILVRNLDFKNDSIHMEGKSLFETGHDRLNLTWVKSENKMLLHFVDREVVGLGKITFTATYSHE